MRKWRIFGYRAFLLCVLAASHTLHPVSAASETIRSRIHSDSEVEEPLPTASEMRSRLEEIVSRTEYQPRSKSSSFMDSAREYLRARIRSWLNMLKESVADIPRPNLSIPAWLMRVFEAIAAIVYGIGLVGVLVLVGLLAYLGYRFWRKFSKRVGTSESSSEVEVTDPSFQFDSISPTLAGLVALHHALRVRVLRQLKLKQSFTDREVIPRVTTTEALAERYIEASRILESAVYCGRGVNNDQVADLIERCRGISL